MSRTKITYEPMKELVIKDFIKFDDLNDFLYTFANLRAAGQPVALNWAEGVVFVHMAMQPVTDRLVEDFLKGRAYILMVNFALMEEYKSSLIYKSAQGEVPVPVMNVSSSEMLCEVARWLKNTIVTS